MTAIAHVSGDLRLEAARLAFALIRFEQVAAHTTRADTPPGTLRLGTEGYVFLPSLRTIPRDQVDAFLISLPSPALLSPTTIRGIVALTLLHELSGERRRGAEKTLSNFAEGLDEVNLSLGLAPTSRVLLEFDDEAHVFSFAAVREYTQQFAVQVGWNIGPLEGDTRADACMRLMRGDGQRFRGQSCMLPPWFGKHKADNGAT